VIVPPVFVAFVVPRLMNMPPRTVAVCPPRSSWIWRFVIW
jgi:deoxycytidine triphosphate deaminase